jgi:hypothetical protein
MLFKEVIALHSKNHMKPGNTLCEQNVELMIIKAGGIHSYHRALNGYAIDPRSRILHMLSCIRITDLLEC